nr:RecName: Full=Leiurutoxin-3; AltName: Full=Leiurutoxin III; AltName: Full=Potassium channel toxin alpha-KTx [Leiurus quinquestriatus quinquestriatus]AAB23863.1 leiurutoxin III, LeTX III {N-terminal} [Leiurus quinquestriatus=scorpions, venom, Peptide Partial, 14 aa] [Leiurus quinquestriatus]
GLIDVRCYDSSQCE